MNKKKILFCMLFLAVFLLGTTNHSITIRGTTKTSFTLGEIKNKLIPLSSANETIFGTPVINPSDPSSTNDVLITCPINDTDGIKNATLYWKYTTINSTTEYNTTMVSAETLVVDVTVCERTGYITNTGNETTSPSNWYFGEYIYETQAGATVSQIEVNEIVALGPTTLVYVLIQAKNRTTGDWEERYFDGAFGNTANVAPYPPSYSSSELTAGYRIYAVSYRGSTPRTYPTFTYLRMYETGLDYQGMIPAIDQPTWVDNRIEAYDLLNNWAESDPYSFLMDTKPSVQFNDLPTVVADSGSLYLNVTVTDADGYATLGVGGVTAYYQIENQTGWTPVTLAFVSNTSSTAAFYNGTFTIGTYSGMELDLYIYVNATDHVGPSNGRNGTTGIETILIDGQSPLVENIVVEGGVSIPGVEDVVLVTSNVTITADFLDPAGIDEVYIYYAIPNGTTFIKQPMINLTSSEPDETTVSYTTTLPPANETRYVEYYFEAKDYLENTGTSSSYFYYADDAAPILSALRVYPNLISEDTEVNVLFNATDPSKLEDSIVWYQLSGESWDSVIAHGINYNLLIDYQETYTADSLPILIQDKNTTTIDLEIRRKIKVDAASVTVDLTHENAADLRIWLKGGDKRVLLYDRMPNTQSFTVTVDLFAHDFREEDFSNSIFQLEIEDFSLDFSGSVTDFQIVLFHHSIPLGYQFRGIIPPTTVDTDVQFCITLTDLLLNQANSSFYTYYADALAPTINVTPIISPLDLYNSYFIEVSANVTDAGGILDVYLYYKFAVEDEWTITAMKLVSGDLYNGDIIINSKAGDAFFKVRAFDLLSHSAETDVTQVNFSNGLYPVIIVRNVLSDPLDMNKNKIFTVQAEIKDTGVITSATLFYRFKSSGKWTELTLEFDTDTGYYFGNIELPWKNGLLQFKIIATDDSNFTAETDVFAVKYINSGGVNLVWVIVPSAVGGAALIGGAVFFVLKKRRKWGKK